MGHDTITSKELQALKKIFRLGVHEWLLLYLIVKNGGVLSRTEIGKYIGEDFRQTLTRQKLSRAHHILEKNGVKTYRSFGLHFQLDPELQTQYSRLFSAITEISSIMDEQADKAAELRLKKNGKLREIIKTEMENDHGKY